MTSTAGRQALVRAVAVAAGTRGVVTAVAVAATLISGTGAEIPLRGFDHAFDGWPLGDAVNRVLAPVAHWDATWYLRIAADGYSDYRGLEEPVRPAFFPLYPLLVRLAAGFQRDPGIIVIAAYAVSFAAFAGALYLLHRLVELEVGRRYAVPAMLLLALFPGALFFSTPYSESLFLLLSVGAFYAARTGRFAWAGVLAGAASATRAVGIVLILPLLVFYFYGPRADREPDGGEPGIRPRYRPRPDLLWLVLAPVGLAVYAVYLEAEGYGALAFMKLQGAWGRELAGPIGGLWRGTEVAFGDIGQLADRLSGTPVYSQVWWWLDSVNLAALVFGVVAGIGALRRLPPAYGVYALAALAVPLSTPGTRHPLLSLPRFVAVLFPLFIWLALVCERRRKTAWVLVLFAVLLLLFTERVATGEFFA